MLDNSLSKRFALILLATRQFRFFLISHRATYKIANILAVVHLFFLQQRSKVQIKYEGTRKLAVLGLPRGYPRVGSKAKKQNEKINIVYSLCRYKGTVNHVTIKKSSVLLCYCKVWRVMQRLVFIV